MRFIRIFRSESGGIFQPALLLTSIKRYGLFRKKMNSSMFYPSIRLGIWRYLSVYYGSDIRYAARSRTRLHRLKDTAKFLEENFLLEIICCFHIFREEFLPLNVWGHLQHSHHPENILYSPLPLQQLGIFVPDSRVLKDTPIHIFPPNPKSA